MSYFLLLALELAGIGMLVYAYPIVKICGSMDWAEQKLGPGGTYTAWRLIGIVLMVAAPMAFRAGLLG
jgi:hypothetical protein